MVLVQECRLLSAVGHPVLLMAYAIHLPFTSLPFSVVIFSPCLLSFQNSWTLGRLISIQIIKALQPGWVVHPVLNLFWDATLCCVITYFISPTVRAHTWSQLDGSGWKQSQMRPMDQKSIADDHDKWGARPGVRKPSWTNQPFIQGTIGALLWPQWVALCVCMSVVWR